MYQPGTVFPPHVHEEDKVVCVLAGRFPVSMGGQSVVLEAGGRLEVPRRAIHQAEVMGSEPAFPSRETRRQKT